MSRKWSTLVLFLLATPLLALGQNTGKISGRVLDAATGESLPGANVLVVGTQLGTITDVDGNYFILGVPVGEYDVQASFVGYQAQTVSGVEISSGYTREINFELQEGVELQEIVVEYERPLIQKDAIGVPKIATSEELVNLPVRGVQAVAATQAGIVSEEGSNTLNIRGGRGAEVTYYIDGVKVVGSGALAMPQSAIQEQEMIIGNISARYGDAMSGVINITTKSGAPNYFGSVEAISSQGLDPYGYNLASGTFGGPIVPNRVSFFIAGEYLDQADSNPRAIGQRRVRDDVLDFVRNNPTSLAARNAEGGRVYIPLPGGLSNGAELPIGNDGQVVVQNGQIVASDGTVINVPEGTDPSSINFVPVQSASTLSEDDFVMEQAKLSNGYNRLALDGNISINPVESVRLRLGGRWNTRENESISDRSVLFAPETYGINAANDWQVFGAWTQYLSNSTFYQVQVDYSKGFSESYDPRFGTDPQAFLEDYGAIENHPVIQGFKNVTYRTEERVNDAGETVTVRVPVYGNAYGDGPSIGSETIASLVTPPGGQVQGYSKSDNSQLRFTATATTQVGRHQLEFGGEYEQQTRRYWGISPRGLAQYYADDDPEAIDPNDPRLNPEGYARYEDIPLDILEGYVSYYGYNVRGTERVEGESIPGYVNNDVDKPEEDYNIAPYKPIYYGGYVQDKLEFRDIVLNLGLRLDVFDNNTRVLSDPYTRRPIERANVVADRPANIGEDFAVYYAGNAVVGYRNNEGTFYDATGQAVNPGDVLLAGRPRLLSADITEDMFEDYKPQVTLMPRIGVSFPVTDQALFFARYGITSQRPSTATFVRLDQFAGTGTIGNTNLEPEKTTEYELGFRQRVGARAALTISGFFRQIENLIQYQVYPEAFPNTYITYANRDFGTVKGAEFGFDLRRTNGVSANVNYTLSFAQGTGSSSTTTSVIVWVDEVAPNFISPLDFDQRHTINGNIDYRLGAGEGPEVFGARLFENFGANLLFQAGSGTPYTAQTEPSAVNVSKASEPSGGINENRLPWWSRVDLKLDRRFPLSNDASLTAFLWVQNLLDTDRVQSVWRATGLADNDGFLATPEGQAFLSSQGTAAETLYLHRTQPYSWYGIPRQTRLGVRFDF